MASISVDDLNLDRSLNRTIADDSFRATKSRTLFANLTLHMRWLTQGRSPERLSLHARYTSPVVKRMGHRSHVGVPGTRCIGRTPGPSTQEGTFFLLFIASDDDRLSDILN